MAIKRISSDYLTLPRTLGEYVHYLHKPFKWTTTEDGSIVHLKVILNDVEGYLAYMLTSDTSTRSSRKLSEVIGLIRSHSHFMPALLGSLTTTSTFTHGHNSITNLRTVRVCFGIRFTMTTILVYGRICDAMEMEPGYGKDYAVDPF
jgi:hypothetical protein